MTHRHKVHPNKRRKDKLMRKLVDIVANIADSGRTDFAAGVCAGEGVPFEVALRVITKPKQRRMYFYPDIDHHEVDMSILTPEKEVMIDKSHLDHDEKERLKLLLRTIESNGNGVFIDPAIGQEIESLTLKSGLVSISENAH